MTVTVTPVCQPLLPRHQAFQSCPAQLTATTAQLQKKRKLAPFATATEIPAEQIYDPSLHARAGSSPSSSPQPSDSQAPSPTSSNTTRNPTPPRYLPPHLHDEVLPSKEDHTGVSTPSGDFANISIDSGSSVDMSVSDNGRESVNRDSDTQQSTGGTSPNASHRTAMSSRTLGRSASPAKRSATHMESGSAPGSFAESQADAPSDFDEAMSGMTAANSVDTGTSTPGQASMAASTSATSVESEQPPPYSADDVNGQPPSRHGNYTTEELDKQAGEVRQMLLSPLEDGQAGYAVSTKWLRRVLARTSEGQQSTDYTKEDREGDIGQMDNTDIVPDGAFTGPHLHDAEKKPFVPLKPGLSLGEDLEFVPYKAYGIISSSYGQTLGQKPIIRYAHNTAPDSPMSNMQYELYPPVFTIRKVPFGAAGKSTRPPSPPTATGSAVENLKLHKQQREALGQTSSDDAVKLIASRNERFQSFLLRAKKAAGIPVPTKVRIFRMLNPAEVTTDKTDTQTTVLSPPPSRQDSPKRKPDSNSKLVVDTAAFAKLELGKDLEFVNAPDETENSKYNGKSQMQLYGLFDDQNLIFEEQMGGPAGGEFASDSKKKGGLFSRKNNGTSDASSTSRGASPAPGAMMTRGRARRDGRTRGTVGLSNLGNTCYMNSALQCIRSVEELAVFFLADKYKTEINTDNPLGHNGIMAKKYAEVLQNIYGDSTGSSYSPSNFKRTLGSCAPLFSGYGQQDSQEFLSFLVDALHEDLNRVIKKPYIENPDSDDKTVHDPKAIIELGEKYRANHKARNDSVAMDLFSGFYKNTMECPVCDKVSVTFDPYSLLTVQLPVENTWQHAVAFVPYRGRLVKHALDVDKNTSVAVLKQMIASKHPGTQGKKLWMAEIYNNKVYKVFEDHMTIGDSGIVANDLIFMFELEDVPLNIAPPSKKSIGTFYSYSKPTEVTPDMEDEMADRFSVPVFHRRRNKNRFSSSWELDMQPFYIVVTREQSQDYEAILKKVLIGVQQMTSRHILSEMDARKPAHSASRDELQSGTASGNEEGKPDETGVSDGSVPSEDGYVNITLDKAEPVKMDDNSSPSAGPAPSLAPIPENFMDSDYFVEPSLRTMFGMNYARSKEGLHCTGMTGFDAVRNMHDRVKQPVRRPSVESSASDRSTTSEDSKAEVVGETEEESDEDESLPDANTLMRGNMPLAHEQPESEEDELQIGMNNVTRRMSGDYQQNRRKGAGNKNKFKPQKTYSKKDKRRENRRRGNNQRPGSSQSHHSAQSQRALKDKPVQDTNPYYIKLGEGIVLDWQNDAFEGLFAGDDPDGFRGSYVYDETMKTLPTFPDPEMDAKKQQRAYRKKHGITLDQCFAETGKREVLSEDNAWYCGRCKELRQATKTLEIWTIPDILVVHLKRFSSNSRMRDKIDVLVDYPIEGLDLTKMIGLKEEGKEYLYDLFAVDNHYGGLGGGHYTAMAQNFYDKKWYDYNDSSVSQIGSEERLHSPAAYLLFYRRRSEQPLGPKYLQDLVLESRNPEPASNEEDDSDSGKGRLGDHPRSLHLPGSSSVSTGAGVGGAAASLRGGGSQSGALAGLNRKKTSNDQGGGFIQDEGIEMEEDDDERMGLLNGKQLYGPARPPAFGLQGNGNWGFDGLGEDEKTDVEDGADMLLTATNDDASSTAAVNSAYGDDHDSRLMEDFGDALEYPNDLSAGRGTPDNDIHSFEQRYFSGYPDDDTYSDAPEAMQIEHAPESSPPAAEIRVEDEQEGHVKMD